MKSFSRRTSTPLKYADGAASTRISSASAKRSAPAADDGLDDEELVECSQEAPGPTPSGREAAKSSCTLLSPKKINENKAKSAQESPSSSQADPYEFPPSPLRPSDVAELPATTRRSSRPFKPSRALTESSPAHQAGAAGYSPLRPAAAATTSPGQLPSARPNFGSLFSKERRSPNKPLHKQTGQPPVGTGTSQSSPTSPSLLLLPPSASSTPSHAARASPRLEAKHLGILLGSRADVATTTSSPGMKSAELKPDSCKPAGGSPHDRPAPARHKRSRAALDKAHPRQVDASGDDAQAPQQQQQQPTSTAAQAGNCSDGNGIPGGAPAASAPAAQEAVPHTQPQTGASARHRATKRRAVLPAAPSAQPSPLASAEQPTAEAAVSAVSVPVEQPASKAVHQEAPAPPALQDQPGRAPPVSSARQYTRSGAEARAGRHHAPPTTTPAPTPPTEQPAAGAGATSTPAAASALPAATAANPGAEAGDGSSASVPVSTARPVSAPAPAGKPGQTSASGSVKPGAGNSTAAATGGGSVKPVSSSTRLLLPTLLPSAPVPRNTSEPSRQGSQPPESHTQTSGPLGTRPRVRFASDPSSNSMLPAHNPPPATGPTPAAAAAAAQAKAATRNGAAAREGQQGAGGPVSKAGGAGQAGRVPVFLPPGLTATAGSGGGGGSGGGRLPSALSPALPVRLPTLPGLARTTQAARKDSGVSHHQSVAEAQENGEALQLQDDASYALDGLRPSCSTASHRESLISLAEMLATRRGRAALRADGLADRVLSCAAQLPVAVDPVMRVAMAGIILALSAPDAHASYLISVPVLTLAGQMIQAPDLPDTSTSATTPLDTATAAALARALKVVKEGSLARQTLPLMGAAGAPLRRVVPLIALALHAATTTDAARILFTDQTKEGMRKAGLLTILAQRVSAHCQALTTCLHLTTAHQPAPHQQQQRQGSSSCPAATPDPSQQQQQQGDAVQEGAGSDGGGVVLADGGRLSADALSRIRGLLVELRLLIQVLENATFTCPDNEQELLSIQVTRPASAPAATPATTITSADSPPASTSNFLESVLQCISIISHLLTLASPSRPAGSSPQQGCQQASAGCPLLAAECSEALQAALGLLMNLTTNQNDARDWLRTAGGLEVVLRLVSWGAAASLDGVPAQAASQGTGGDVGGAADAQPTPAPAPGAQVHTNRAHTVRHVELLTVALGVLINITCVSEEARLQCRQLQVECAGPAVAASNSNLGHLGQCKAGSRMSAGGAHTCGVIPLLCGVLSAMIAPAAALTAGGQGSRVGVQQEGRVSGGGSEAGLRREGSSSSPDAPGRTKAFSRGRAGRASGNCVRGGSAAADLSSGLDKGKARAGLTGSPASGPDSAAKQAVEPSSNSGVDGDGDVVMVSRDSGDVFEVTESQLEVHHDEGEASIVQVYTSMLLGFLIMDCPSAVSAACGLLPGGSLAPLVGSISQMLQFYLQAGAITDSSRDALVRLLQTLAPLVEAEVERAGEQQAP